MVPFALRIEPGTAPQCQSAPAALLRHGRTVCLQGTDNFLKACVAAFGQVQLFQELSDPAVPIAAADSPDNGICFVGDLEPIEYLDAYDGNSKLKSDWNLVMSYNPKRIYYAHANEKIL